MNVEKLNNTSCAFAFNNRPYDPYLLGRTCCIPLYHRLDVLVASLLWELVLLQDERRGYQRATRQGADSKINCP